MSFDMSGSHPAMDVDEHKSTYEGFIKGFVVSIVLITITLIAMAYFLL